MMFLYQAPAAAISSLEHFGPCQKAGNQGKHHNPRGSIEYCPVSAALSVVYASPGPDCKAYRGPQRHGQGVADAEKAEAGAHLFLRQAVAGYRYEKRAD